MRNALAGVTAATLLLTTAPNADAVLPPCTHGKIFAGINGFGPSFSGKLYAAGGARECGGVISGDAVPVNPVTYTAMHCAPYTEVALCAAQAFWVLPLGGDLGAQFYYRASSITGGVATGQCYLHVWNSGQCEFTL